VTKQEAATQPAPISPVWKARPSWLTDGSRASALMSARAWARRDAMLHEIAFGRTLAGKLTQMEDDAQ